MMSVDSVKARIGTLSQRTAHILDDLTEKTQQFDLSKLPDGLEAFRRKLSTNTYDVLVVGEAKRGKSSFINALIGRDLLPVDVKVATSQVFCVSQAEPEAYRLRFEDETTRPIDATELLEYGSQTAADQSDTTQLDLARLRWIEVDVPAIRFVPQGIRIMDTPGLGSLYAPHAQITQRFVPGADAVIFVLDSGSPVTQPELDFLSSIVEVTPHIFFIQTKIDAYDGEDWQRVQHRNEEILQQHFSKRLTDTRVWPVSSHNLMKAWRANNPAGLLKVAHQEELAGALQTFLFRVAGWNRCKDALVLAELYYTTSRKMLSERLSALQATSTQELVDRQQRLNQSRQQIAEDWSPQSNKRQTFQLKVQRIAQTGKQSLMDLLESGGELEAKQCSKIDAISSIEEANKLGAVLSEQVVTEVTNKWRSVCDQSRRQCSLLLGSLIEDTDSLLLPVEDPNLALHIGSPVALKADMWAKFSEMQEDFVQGGRVAWVAAVVASVFIPTITVGVALVGVAVAGIWAAARGWKAASGSQLEEARQKLHEHLSLVLQEIRKRFLQRDQNYDNQSLLNYYFDSLVEAMTRQVEDTVSERLQDLQKEAVRLDEQAKLDTQQRKIKAEEVSRNLAAWDELGRTIRSTNAELDSLEGELATTAAPAV